MGKKFFALFDFIIFFVFIFVLCMTAAAIRTSGNKSRVIIDTSEGQWIYDVHQNAELSFSGPLGETSVAISDGCVYVSDSPCANKTCAACPPIRRSGEWIACLPNRVVVRIENTRKESEEFDATGF
ncbi:MAG: NusG domain II-containing protein [Bacteroides sp.]|nr:NusG domain II-containing protein [Prevotella sp.]MCM1407119.1 NusG domain II-containing protein [Treponema brennaborense]MCM1470271.1 NusG domain II-containing protein [Bacteroides sp.]